MLGASATHRKPTLTATVTRMPKRRARATRPKGNEARALAFEPKHPVAVALASFSTWIVLLSIPMLSGRFLASPYNDQYSSGYAYRSWAAESWKTLGHVPLWNPEIFGGMPFVAGMHGDVLYPTAWLRLALPTHVAMNLGFVVHYVLAALFMYGFLRRWGVSWTGSIVGGLAYQLAGVVGTYVSPGHDGKLFVTTLLPLALTGLTLGVRDRRLEGYALLAVGVGLIMLSPHPQMEQYALLASGLFTLFLVFGTGDPLSPRARLTSLALAVLGVAVGVGIAAIQYIPFHAYIPYSPRDASVLNDFAWSAAYAIPWAHVPELVFPRFTGETFNRSYWGPNGLKLHSEYLGLAVVALAAVGATDTQRRRMLLWLSATGLLFLLIALGSSTPFYRSWWEIVPFAKSMRAPGMAAFVMAFVTATLASFGVDRIAAGSSRRFVPAAFLVGGLVALLGVSGIVGELVQSLGRGVEVSGLAERGSMAVTAARSLRGSALGAGLALVAIGLATWASQRRLIGPRVWATALVAIVGTDLWLNVRPFWQYSDAHDELFGGDAIKARLKSVPRPFRVWDVDYPGVPSVYPGAALMADRIPQLYGHHGNEPHAFDVLNGRQGSSLRFSRAGDPRILDLFAVNYLIVQSAALTDSVPGFHAIVSNVATSSGTQATLLERDRPIAYARFIPAAAMPSSPSQMVPAVLAPELEIDRLVLLDSAAGLARGAIPNPLPPASDLAVTFASWKPGEMRLQLGGGAPSAGYVLVSENWDAEWMATVDGRDGRVLRGNGTLITVPVPAGARDVVLRYAGRAFALGKLVTVAALVVVAIGLVLPVVARRSRVQGRRGVASPG